jgi:NAD(P)-dependent dehydrogenase (short-subunit alcohol dehydrogenase family)
MADHKAVAMVTGAGSGIGRVCAEVLAEDGFAVVVAGRRAELIEETASEIRDGGGSALAVACDVTDPAAVAGLFAQTEAEYGRLDFLFNNAGRMSPRVPLDEMSFAEWHDTTETNLTGTFLCLQEAFRLMKRQSPQGGRIINNGSIAAHSPRAGLGAYTASKHGISGLTKQGALEGRDFDICVGQIDIGNARTSMLPNAAEGTMDVADVAGAIRYMANLPLEANMLFMTIHARTMPFVGRG